MTEPAKLRRWVLSCGERYWPNGSDALTDLPIPAAPTDSDAGELTRILLPDWATDLAVDRSLLAYSGTVVDGPQPQDWQRCDWLTTAWYMLTGHTERSFELRNGPVLSYAFRLPSDKQPLFERAWVNRIFLFLRRWAARERGVAEEVLFGPVPTAEIVLTHDVDAIRLTPEIRAKQAAFQLANGASAVLRGRPGIAGKRLTDATRFAFAPANLRTLRQVRDMERAAGLRSILHFYGGAPGLKRRTPRRLLIDPAYDINSSYLRDELAAFHEGGWTIGLHQSFDAWQDESAMSTERQRVAASASVEVVHCRQHWLHFSWQSTWAAQEAAGLFFDSTLGFNDRPGFRAGHALRIKPWDFARDASMRIEVTPMLFMDSHFYDYANLNSAPVTEEMKRWLDEVELVGGEITVNWHTHTITDIYGWGDGYEQLLGLLA